MRVGHFERSQDPLLDEKLDRQSRDRGYQGAEGLGVEVRVDEPFARRVGRPLFAGQVHGIEQGRLICVAGGIATLHEAGSMGEEVANRDVRRRSAAERVQVPADRLVQPDAPLFRQHQRCGPNHGLGHRGETEDRVPLHGHEVRVVGPSHGLVEHDLPVDDHEDFGSHEVAGDHPGVKTFLEQPDRVRGNAHVLGALGVGKRGSFQRGARGSRRSGARRVVGPAAGGERRQAGDHDQSADGPTSPRPHSERPTRPGIRRMASAHTRRAPRDWVK